MRFPEPPPKAWGNTKVGLLETTSDGTHCFASWQELVDPPDTGIRSHGSMGSIPADTVLVAIADELIALADVFHVKLENLYAYDAEYYVVLRIREILDRELWNASPWKNFGPGNVVHAWDKFHRHDYFRTEDEVDLHMSYGGDWFHLEDTTNDHYPPEKLPNTSLPTRARLLTAIREGNTSRVLELLGAGATASDDLSPEGITALDLRVSIPRDRSPLWESIQNAPAEVTEALLAAGAAVDARPEGGLTALHGAILAHKPDHARVLLRFGADPLAVYSGRTAHELARGTDPSIAAIIDEHVARLAHTK
jgi:hypothetical protein